MSAFSVGQAGFVANLVGDAAARFTRSGKPRDIAVMKSTFFALALVLPLLAIAQNERSTVLRELERDIWQPFVEGVNTDAPALYNGMNAEDFQWVAGGPRVRIMNRAEYIEDAHVVMEARRRRGQRGEIELRFLERHVRGDFAAETYIVKYTQTEPNKEATVSYGTTIVFSRRNDGRWEKIVQYPQATPVGADDFARAEPMFTASAPR